MKISICNMSGNVFREIEYTDFNELHDKLESIIISYDSDILIQLVINNEILNNFDIIDTLILSKITEYCFITIIFSQKKNYIV